MKSTDDIKQLVKSLRKTTRGELDERVLADASEAMDQLADNQKTPTHDRAGKGSIFMRHRKRISGLVAACVIVGLGVWWLASREGPVLVQTAYAQIMEGIEQADTVHLTTDFPSLGSRTEMWYDRKKGFLRYDVPWADGTKLTMIDNGSECMLYDPSSEEIVKASSLPGVTDVVEQLTQLRSVWDKFSEAPHAKERVIDGESCRCLSSEDGKQRMYVWIDRRERIRAMETYTTTDGQPTLVQDTRVDYDVPIASDVFEPDLLHATRTVNPTEAFVKMAVSYTHLTLPTN